MFRFSVRRFASIASVFAVAVTWISTDAVAQLGTGGGQAAGVIVDANGVLRTKFVRDVGGHQTRARMAAAKATLKPELARQSKLRKVSLTRLEKAIAQRKANGQGVTEEMRYLAGLTRIQNVFFYPESGDIVIAGPAEGFGPDLTERIIGIHSGRAILELQDLVTALRAYGPNGRRTNVISVSIDPTQEGLQKMQQFLVRIAGRVRPSDANRIASGLQESLGLQTVSVNGVHPQTHFAQVLVEADYRMKLIGIGLEKPAVNIVSYVSKANPRDVSRNALQRWFFTPDYESVKVSEDEFAMELLGDGVKLIGEDEAVQGNGARVQTGRVDRASQAFVTSFTAKYGELAKKSPVYAQMRNLIDMAIVSAFIQQQDYYGQANWKMEIFGSEEAFPVQTYNVPRQVETAVNAIWKGNTLMTPIGGGVQMQPTKALDPNYVKYDEDGTLKKLRSTVSVEGLADGQWWWD